MKWYEDRCYMYYHICIDRSGYTEKLLRWHIYDRLYTWCTLAYIFLEINTTIYLWILFFTNLFNTLLFNTLLYVYPATWDYNNIGAINILIEKRRIHSNQGDICKFTFLVVWSLCNDYASLYVLEYSVGNSLFNIKFATMLHWMRVFYVIQRNFILPEPFGLSKTNAAPC